MWAVAQNLQPRLPEEAGKAGKAGENKGSTTATQEIDLENKVVQDLFRQELNREVQNRPGYRADDRIGPYKLIQRTVFDGKWDVDPNAEDPASRCYGTLSRYH